MKTGTQHVGRYFGRPKRVIALVAGLAILGVYAAMPAFAVHDTGVFQLDRNALTNVDNGTVLASHDWDQICAAVIGAANCGNPTGTAGTSVVSFDVDPNGQTIFTGGGSKDPKDIQPNWLYKSGSVPDKDELLHSFAARYSAPIDNTPPTLCPANVGQTTCELLYFGADRLDASGDSQIGFWFFQNRIGLTSTASNGGFKFSGVHKDGDILVLSDFTQGGGNPNIKILMWNSSSDPTIPGGGTGSCSGNPKNCDNLIVLGGSSSAPADCIGPPTVGPGDGFCATVNNQTETAPWSFLDKSGSSNFLPGEFYEGGINLSTLPFSVASECFSSFETETRSSADADAVLKDFVLGNFGNCTATMTTQVSSTSVFPGDQVRDTATVVGSQSTKTPSGNVTFYLCSFAAGTTDLCDGTAGHVGIQLSPDGTLSGSGGTATANSPYVNTAASPSAPGRYCFRAHWGGDGNYTTPIDEWGQSANSNECFTVAKIPSTTVTTPSTTTVTLASINAGGFVTDTALVTGTAAGGDPTGTVNFFICGPIASGTCDGTTNVGTAVAGNPVTLVPDGTVPPNDTTYTGSATSGHVTSSTITSVGRYCFRAEYSGDSHYLGSSDSGTGDAECFTVTDQSSVTSAQDWLPNDTATVTAAGGTALNGTLTFTLYETADCTGTAVANQTYTRTLTNATSLADRTKSTSNLTYKVSADKTVSWLVTYTGDSNVGSSTPVCETTSLTIDNDVPVGP